MPRKPSTLVKKPRRLDPGKKPVAGSGSPRVKKVPGSLPEERYFDSRLIKNISGEPIPKLKNKFEEIIPMREKVRVDPIVVRARANLRKISDPDRAILQDVLYRLEGVAKAKLKDPKELAAATREITAIANKYNLSRSAVIEMLLEIRRFRGTPR